MVRTCSSRIRSQASVDELLAFSRVIKGRDMLTNCTLMPQAMRELMNNNRLYISIGVNAAVLILFDTEDLARLWFYTKNEKSINEVQQLLPETPARIVCDVVGRAGKVDRLVLLLERCGYVPYAVFQRMVCHNASLDLEVDDSEVELASVSDAQAVLSLITTEFDPITAHLPSLEEIENRIRDGEVLVVRDGEEVIAASVFKSKDLKMALLDYVVVEPAFRRKGLGQKMLQRKWSEHDEDVSYFLWVNRDCEGPVRYHEKNGFKADGTLDYIFLTPDAIRETSCC